MRIKDFELQILDMDLKKPFITSLRRVDKINDIIIKLTTDTELIGYGAASPVRAITGSSNESVIKELQEKVFPALKGKSIDEQDIFDRLYALDISSEAKACTDIALYDLLSKRAHMSLHTYLGARTNTLHTDLTISVGTPEHMQAQSAEAIAGGFKVLKVKLDDDIEQNVLRLRAINKVLKKQTELRLDPNQALKLLGCLDMLTQVPINQIECIEQPFAAEDIASMKALKEKELIPVLADESVFDANDARKLLEENAADMLNIKLMKCGGIYGALKILEVAREFHKPCMIGSMLEGPISLLAAAHFALSSSKITMADLDSPHYLKEHPLLELFNLQGERISLGEQLGIGVDETIKSLALFPSA